MDLLQALLKARADPLGRGPKGVTALHRAAMEGHEEVRGWLWGASLSCTKVGLAAKCNCNDRPVLWITAVEDLWDSYPFVRVNLLAWGFPPALSVVASDKGKMSFSNDPFWPLTLFAGKPSGCLAKICIWIICYKFVNSYSFFTFGILFQYFEICISSVLQVYAPHDYPRLSAITFPDAWEVATMLLQCCRQLGVTEALEVQDELGRTCIPSAI